MNRRSALLALPLLALTSLLAAPDAGFAQGWGRGGFRSGMGGYGGWANYGNSGTWSGVPNYGSGYGGWGSQTYGPAYMPSQTWGGVYSGQPYTFGSAYGPNYVQPAGFPAQTSGYATVMPGYGGYQAFYPPTGVAQPATQPTTDSSRAYIHVRVPADAQVMFDGSPTKQTGAERMFMTPSLAAGSNYSYEISAKWMDNGQPREQTRTVRLTPGQTVNVDFSAPQGAAPQGAAPQGGTPQLQTNPSATPLAPGVQPNQNPPAKKNLSENPIR